MVAVSPPDRNEAGAVTLPVTTKLSVPSTKESSMISIEALWLLSDVAPCKNVTSCLSSLKSSSSTKKNSENAKKKRACQFYCEFLTTDFGFNCVMIVEQIFTLNRAHTVHSTNVWSICMAALLIFVYLGLISSLLCTTYAL